MDQIDQVRQKTDIIELLSSYIQIKKAGRNFKALCPFHSEKTPSLIISPERQIWKCFGCGLGGDVFKFLVEYEKMTFGEALRYLADKTGIKLKSFTPSPALKEKDKLLAINHLTSEFYHYILLNHKVGKKGLEYLLKRGITQASIKFFKLGYAPDNWETLINFLVKKKGYKDYEIEKAGLVVKGRGYYDRFRGRIMFPLTDHRGNILGFSGRTLQKDLKGLPASRQGAKYINTPETAVYHKGELFYGLHQAKNFIKKKNKAVIVEGEFDVISSFQTGVKNTIATKGTALTEDQVNLIKRFTSTIILALDRDIAGDEAIKRGIELADLAGLIIRVVQIKHGKDPDECARHSAKLWRESVDKAIPVYDFYLNSATKRFDENSPEGKKQISEMLAPLLLKIQNEVVKSHYVKKLAEILNTEEEVIIKELQRAEKTGKIFTTTQIKPFVKTQKQKSRKERLEEFLLSLIVQNIANTRDLVDSLKLDFFTTQPAKKIFTFFKKHLNENKKFNLKVFIKSLPEELIEYFDNLYLADLDLIAANENLFNKELRKTQQELKKIYLKDKLSSLIELIKEKEKSNKSSGLRELQLKFSKLTKELKELS